MRKLIQSMIVGLVLTTNGSAQIIADFRTSEGDFNVVLDYVNAPLAVSNFIHLAGKEDDILETRTNGVQGVPGYWDPNHWRYPYYSVTSSDAPKLPLQVYYMQATDTMRAFYEIRQNEVPIGGVEVFQLANYHADITGQDRIRLAQVRASPDVFRITLRYPRPWLDARDQRVKDAPMYRNLRITQVETGKRFFAGGVTNSPIEHPGYHFQDEVLRVPGNIENPYGTAFNTAYILAMDTLGPNRNGCRFFITSASDRTWNGRYTAFGAVERNAGRLVVDSIANAATAGNQEPAREMFIYDITFRRGGVVQLPDGTPGDATFFEGYHQSFLPGNIESVNFGFDRDPQTFSLLAPWRKSTQTILYQSTDLRNWSGGFVEFQSPDSIGPVVTDLTEAVRFSPRLFVKGFTTEIPVWPSSELSLAGAQLSFKVNSGIDEGSLNFVFGSGGFVASYTIDMEIEQRDKGVVSASGTGSCSVTYDSSQGPYKGVLKFSNVTGPLNVGEITLHFDSTRFANTPGIDESSIIRRFDARTTDPEADFLDYSGVYQKVK